MVPFYFYVKGRYEDEALKSTIRFNRPYYPLFYTRSAIGCY